jgi:hypothetical protein
MLMVSACFFLSRSFAQTATIEKPLTNKDIVSMVSEGLSSAVIKAAIERSKTNFDLSPAAMIELKKFHTPDDIMLAMISKARAKAADAPEDTLVRMPTGIYVRSDKGYRLVEPHMFLGSSSKGAVGMLKKTFGSLINQPIKTTVADNHAPIKISEIKPIFIFILDFPARSPEEFFLIRLSASASARAFSFQKISNAPGIINANDSIKVSYSSKKIREGIYEVAPTHSFQPGEYGFIYNAAEHYKGNAFTGFDFAIAPTTNGNQ